jgi:hypothetical protein
MGGNRLLSLTAMLVCVAGPALAQAHFPATTEGCQKSALNDAPMSFRQRACYFGGKLIAPSMLLHAAASAGFGQIAGTPKLPPPGGTSEFGRRFDVFCNEPLFFPSKFSRRFPADFPGSFR